MNSVQQHSATVARKSRPEEVLANIEASLQVPVAEIAFRIRVQPNTNFSEMSLPARVEAAIAENRRYIESLPAEAEVDGLANIASEVLSISTPGVVKREVANLIGSFPNAAVANPEIYLSALVYDLLDKHIPDAVTVLTCRQIRRTCKFVPSISEVLETAESIADQWRPMGDLSQELRSKRVALMQTIERGERVLAHINQEIADGYRTPYGAILRRKSAYAQSAA